MLNARTPPSASRLTLPLDSVVEVLRVCHTWPGTLYKHTGLPFWSLTYVGRYQYCYFPTVSCPFGSFSLFLLCPLFRLLPRSRTCTVLVLRSADRLNSQLTYSFSFLWKQYSLVHLVYWYSSLSSIISVKIIPSTGLAEGSSPKVGGPTRDKTP